MDKCFQSRSPEQNRIIMQNWDKYILIGLVIIVLFILLRMNKVMAVQTTIMVGMAEKLGMTPETNNPKKTISTPHKKNNEETDTDEETEQIDEDEEIVRIAERLYGKKTP